jgi:hypothetical protein
VASTLPHFLSAYFLWGIPIHGPEEIRKALEHGRKQLQPVSGTSDKDADLVFEDTRNNLT